jgi:hypothetical protein
LGHQIRRDRCDNPPDPATIRRNSPAQESLLRLLDQPRTIEELQAMTGKSRSAIGNSLSGLLESIAIKKLQKGRYEARTA